MQDTLTRYLNAMPTSDREREALRAILRPLADRQSTQALSNSTLVIGSVSKHVPKTGAADSYFAVQGKLVKVAAATAMPALVGTVVNATFNLYAFFVDAAGVVTSAMGTAGATLLAIKFPAFPVGKALVGFVIVNPTGTGDFVGGTNDLDDGTILPNAVYVSPDGSFDPSILL